MTDHVTIDHVTLAKDQDGNEWVPASEYRRLELEHEALRCLTVNPSRNTGRALKRLNEGDLNMARLFLEEAHEGTQAAYETAFPPKA